MDENKIREYFLGKIDEAESEDFEAQVISDKNLFELCEVIESELIDEYIQKKLSLSDRELFEKNYLIIESRKKKIQTAGNFFASLEEIAPKPNSQTLNQSWWEKIYFVFRAAPAPAFAILGVLFISVILIIYWSNRPVEPNLTAGRNDNTAGIENDKQTVENKIIKDDLNNNLNAAQTSNSAAVQSPMPANNIQSQNISLPNKTSPSPKPPVSPKPTLATFTLFPGMLRSDDGEQIIKLNTYSNLIRLQLIEPKDAIKYKEYRAKIVTADGTTVFTSANLKSFNFLVPTAKLEKGTYVVFLEGQTSTKSFESVIEYTFRAVR